MISEKDIELMDNYLAGNLSKEEVVIFNNRLKHDQDFKKEFNLISSIADAFKRDELKEELDQLEHKLNKEERFQTDSSSISDDPISIWSPRTSRAKYFAIAASFVFLLGASYFVFYKNEHKHNDTIPMGGNLDSLQIRKDSSEFEDSLKIKNFINDSIINVD